jgi:hypothetical protein
MLPGNWIGNSASGMIEPILLMIMLHHVEGKAVYDPH